MVVSSEHTVKQLRAIAKKKGIKGYSTLRKDELLKRINQGVSPRPSSASKVSATKAAPKRRVSKGVIREVYTQVYDTSLFLVKEPGTDRYSSTYVRGKKAIDLTRDHYKNAYVGYRYIKTPISFLNKIGMSDVAAAFTSKSKPKDPSIRSFPLKFGTY